MVLPPERPAFIGESEAGWEVMKLNDEQDRALQALAKTLRKKKLKGLRNPSKAEGSASAVRVTEISTATI